MSLIVRAPQCSISVLKYNQRMQMENILFLCYHYSLIIMYKTQGKFRSHMVVDISMNILLNNDLRFEGRNAY